MRILFVNRIAWPDQGATALYLTDVAEACAAAGHEVHVLCGTASYREGGAERPAAAACHGGVRYHRVPGGRGMTLLGRALSAAAFLVRAAVRMLRLPKPDVVIGMTDPPFADALAGSIGRLRGARTMHWLMDAYPDVAVAAGVLRDGSLPGRVLGAWMACALRRADAVVVLSPAMRRPILARGVPRKRLHVIENWAPRAVEELAAGPLPPRSDRPITLMYSGTYGVAHDLRPLFDALRGLPSGMRVRLILQVSGSRVAELRDLASSLPVEVVWRDPVPLAVLAASLLEADIHVASVAHGFEHLVTPSKIYAPLALGLPLLAVGVSRGWAVGRRGAHARSGNVPVADGALREVIDRAGVLVVKSARWPRSRREGTAGWVRRISEAGRAC